MLRVAGAALVLFFTALPAAAQTTVPLTVRVGGTASGTVAVVGTVSGLCSTPASTQCTFQIPTGSTVRIAANAPLRKHHRPLAQRGERHVHQHRAGARDAAIDESTAALRHHAPL